MAPRPACSETSTSIDPRYAAEAYEAATETCPGVRGCNGAPAPVWCVSSHLYQSSPDWGSPPGPGVASQVYLTLARGDVGSRGESPSRSAGNRVQP